MTRRLYRSRTDTVVAGLAAGLAEYLSADPALVRIAWAILVPLTGGAALLAYVVGWIVVPESPGVPDAGVASDVAERDDLPGSSPAVAEASRDSTAEGRSGIWVGLGLVLLGAWFLAREYLPSFDWGLIWPLILVAIGVAILAGAIRRTR